MALHLFKVPDTDLLVHYGDGCPPAERPVLSR
jgi:diphthamide synthase subunit DPH2